MKRRILTIAVSLLCALTALMTAPEQGEARPPCPRGQTFSACVASCPADLVGACEAWAGVGVQQCPLASESCEFSNQCYDSTYPPGQYQYAMTCTWLEW